MVQSGSLPMYITSVYVYDFNNSMTLEDAEKQSVEAKQVFLRG